MYDVNLMTAPLISSLTPIWPNLIGPDKYLWSYEFNHHGSCAWRSPTQQGYFNDVIRAFDIVLNPVTALKEYSNILPSD